MLLLVAHRGALNSFFFYLLTIVGPKCPFIVTRNITKRVFETYIDIFDVDAFASLNNPSITPAAFQKRFIGHSSKRLCDLFAPSLFSPPRAIARARPIRLYFILEKHRHKRRG